MSSKQGASWEYTVIRVLYSRVLLLRYRMPCRVHCSMAAAAACRTMCHVRLALSPHLRCGPGRRCILRGVGAQQDLWRKVHLQISQMLCGMMTVLRFQGEL